MLVGRFDGARVALGEAHRFPNLPVAVLDSLHWDVLRLLDNVVKGLERSAAEVPESVGIDTWGVDFGLLDRDGSLLANPYAYRDPRTAGMLDRALERISREELYAASGVQFLEINTLYQLLASEGSALLESAQALLFTPDLLRYWLTGEALTEQTIASTSGLFDPRTRDWAWPVIERLGLPRRLFGPLVAPGAGTAPLHERVSERTGLAPGTPVVAVAGHDTASAVVAVPAAHKNFAYISSGTWSLVGLELRGPVIGQAALASNLTNEWGYDGRVRFLRNVMGLWLVQESRRTWARAGEELSYEELVRVADAAPPGGPLVDPDRPEFLAPGDMPERIRAACRATGQPPPASQGATVRCVLESLACRYRWVIDRLEEASGRRVEVIHIVGGGSRNPLLCRLTAEVTGRPVLAGPVEATALGNVLVQAAARGRVGDLEEIRSVVRASTSVEEYPAGDDPHGLFGRFESMLAGG